MWQPPLEAQLVRRHPREREAVEEFDRVQLRLLALHHRVGAEVCAVPRRTAAGRGELEHLVHALVDALHVLIQGRQHSSDGDEGVALIHVLQGGQGAVGLSDDVVHVSPAHHIAGRTRTMSSPFFLRLKTVNCQVQT